MSERVTGGIRGFAVLWTAQLVSVIGSSLTGFALGVWAYQETGSVTVFALIFTANVVPGIVVAPLAGSLVDRFDRKLLLIVGDSGAALSTLVVAILAGSDRLAVWHIYLATAVAAAFTFLHRTAFYALMPVLVPKRHLGRANALLQIGQGVSIAAPVLAGILLVTIDLLGVLLVDLVSFTVALSLLVVTRVPGSTPPPDDDAGPRRLRDDVGFGWRYLAARPGLLWLVLFSAAFDLIVALPAVLVRPLILGFASPATLGFLEFLGGAGVFAGVFLLSVWGGPRRKVAAIVGFCALGGVFLALHSLRPSVLLIAIAAPLFLLTMPIVNSLVGTVMQLKVDGAALGRVNAAAQMLWQLALPAGALLAGPLADGIFEPALAPDGSLAGSVGEVIGVGAGRGIALLFAVAGLALILLALVSRLNRALWQLEDTVPDAIPDEPLAERSPAGGD